MKTTRENFRNICVAMYEATGLSYYIDLPNNLYYELSNGGNYFIMFYSILNELKTFVAGGGVFKHHLVKLDYSKAPFIYNSLRF